MHFFAEHNLLTSQGNQTDYAFGPVSNDPTNKFNITSRFCQDTPAKAFACQDGLMIVQQSTADESLVNIILKPTKGLQVPFNSVKYFVYRGVCKDNFISGTAIAPKSAGNTETIARLWQTWEIYNSDNSEPTPQCFGYDNSLADSLNIENIYDNSQEDVRALFVREGEWIGNFCSTFEIGLEIIIDDNNLTLDLDFLRAETFQIDVTGLQDLELRVEREKVLSFIDPAAFFGLHYDVGVKTCNGNIKETQKRDELYSLLISKFATKNAVYLDIRNENGYSYNFYENYGDNLGNNIKVGNSNAIPVAQKYATNDWPLLIISNSLTIANNKNDIKINLRIDDNPKPILFFENTNLISEDNKSRFIDEKYILNNTDEWSRDLSFVFPNTGAGTQKDNVAYYINLIYFKQEHDEYNS